ncbi:PEP-CTERM sorting domain-containing protein [Geoalkalibacter halelectricus]|uniref:PEP-CTERM sorting domain-containing protein n=1 Tax=Geoalkalibacter halelectricus TaxID=2847045 RepID=UPI003D1BB2FB
MQKVVWTLLGLLLLWGPSVGAVPIDKPSFSIDAASPSNEGNLTPDDILAPGPVVAVEGADLNLQDALLLGDYDDLNALSFGRDPIQGPLYFSVDRVSVGLPGTDVNDLAQPGVEAASGSVFISELDGSNQLAILDRSLGLQSGFFSDDLNALEIDTLVYQHIYFSIDFLSASNGFGLLPYANDIFIDDFDPLNPFAFGELHMGLLAEDDIDALVLWDIVGPGVLNPGRDIALFSLSPFSPSTFTDSGLEYIPGLPGHLSPADILITDFTGSYSLWASAWDLGLDPWDNVNAIDTVPEPSTLVLLGTALALLAGVRMRQRRKVGA